LFLVRIGSRDSTSLFGWDFSSRLGFGWHPLGGAVDNIAILHEALDHPVAIAGAVYARIDTSGAKVVVSVITNAAVEVLILHGLVAIITVYHPSSAAGAAWLGAECKILIMRCASKGIEEALACGEGSWEWSFVGGSIHRLWRRYWADRLELWWNW